MPFARSRVRKKYTRIIYTSHVIDVCGESFDESHRVSGCGGTLRPRRPSKPPLFDGFELHHARRLHPPSTPQANDSASQKPLLPRAERRAAGCHVAAADSAASLSWRPGRAARLADASRSAAILTRSFLWAKDCANILSRPAAADPGPAAGFRHHGHSAGTLQFHATCLPSSTERTPSAVCMRDNFPADTSGSMSKGYKGGIPAV